ASDGATGEDGHRTAADRHLARRGRSTDSDIATVVDDLAGLCIPVRALSESGTGHCGEKRQHDSNELDCSHDSLHLADVVFGLLHEVRRRRFDVGGDLSTKGVTQTRKALP